MLGASTEVMSLLSFRIKQMPGHMDHVKHIFCCLTKCEHATTGIRAEEVGMLGLPNLAHDWETLAYGATHEFLSANDHEPLGKCVVTMSYE